MESPKLTLLTDLSSVKCSLCLDIFQKPRRISCGHVFCEKCLESYVGLSAPQCPNCRQFFDAHKHQPDKHVEQLLQSSCAQCEGCLTQISLTRLRSHAAACEKAAAIEKLRISQAVVPEPKNAGPNRQTFQCPYCGLRNLDITGLNKHCNERHGRDPRPVVCPVCASMPWGDPTMMSSNFIRHLNIRHKFEYDTYVDYQQDDDDMLRAAIEASLMTQQ